MNEIGRGFLSQQSKKTVWPAIVLILISVFFWIARTYWLGAPYNSNGFGSPGNALYALVLLFFVLVLAASLGYKFLHLFPGNDWTSFEVLSFSLSFGLGIFAYSIFGMGLAGLLQPIHFIFLLIIICLITRNEISFWVNQFISSITNGCIFLQESSFSRKFLFGIGSLIFFLTLLQTLTPPFNYDGLMYHLQGPRLFLETGRISPIFNNWLTFYPSTSEMINLFGIGFGSDIFARLIHFSSLILILLSTYAIAQRILPKTGGGLAIAILTGIPVLFLWGSQANNDLMLVLYQFQAVFLFLLWKQKNKNGLLILSGVMQGLALGSKYLAFSGLAILGLTIWINCWDNLQKKFYFKKAFYSSSIFVVTALIIASPWYLKNLFWTGNSLYPFYLPNKYVDPIQLSLWTNYMGSYGANKGWVDYVLLPIRLFIQPGIFSTWFGVIDIPNPIFVFSVFYPFAIRNFSQEKKKDIHLLAFITLLQFIVWAAGSQQTRFLFSIYPGLSILSCCFLLWMGEKLRFGHKIVYFLVACNLFVSLVIISASSLVVNPYRFLSGGETKREFLGRMVSDYPAMEFIQTKLPIASRVLMLWDGQSYYCDARCVPDLFQSQWTALFMKNPSVSTMKNELVSMSISHLMVNQSDTGFFLAHDPDKQHQKSLNFLLNDFAPKCTKMIFQDDFVEIFDLSFDLTTCVD